ncbi:expressed unknown protein [Seminavis robusta]|uniref:G-protein coupled receptors family 3 profile domain-containing protein n=1 Tax=Seminavis robusta TaxID=568900 RepID=A0A9N8HCJ3_9STRA|nr:expressed unknown protein [Seminavis robusta]|eukprot:Sro321_g116760.1 n/a (814) ;mRNA; f:43885-46326
MIQALQTFSSTRIIPNPQVVALGFPQTSTSYQLAIQGFEAALATQPDITLLRRIPLQDGAGSQAAYDATLQLLDAMSTDDTTSSTNSVQGIYCMDDIILMGAYQAIQDHPDFTTENITLVGTSCNGARELLTTQQQFGTTVEGPFWEGELAILTAFEYIQTGTLQSPFVRFTPNPSITVDDPWQDESWLMDFLGQSYTVDSVCTWSLHYDDRVAGLQSVDVVDDICTVIDCVHVPQGIHYAGLVLCGLNYVLAIFCTLCLFQHLFWSNSSGATGNNSNQPLFLLLVVAGAVVCNTSIIFWSHRNDNPQSTVDMDSLHWDCLLVPWTLVLGHLMTIALLLARMKQVETTRTDLQKTKTKTKQPVLPRPPKPTLPQEQEQAPPEQSIEQPQAPEQAIEQPQPQQSQQEQPMETHEDEPTTAVIITISMKEIASDVLLLAMLDVIVLTVWSVYDPLQWKFTATEWDHNGYIVQASGQCGVQNDWSLLIPLGIAVFHLTILLYGNVLSYQTKECHKHIVGGGIRGIVVALFLAFQLLLVTTPVLVVVQVYNGSVSASYLIKVCFVFGHCMSILLSVVVPRVHWYLGGERQVVWADDTKKEEKQRVLNAILASGGGNAEDGQGRPTIVEVGGFHMVSDGESSDGFELLRSKRKSGKDDGNESSDDSSTDEVDKDSSQEKTPPDDAQMQQSVTAITTGITGTVSCSRDVIQGDDDNANVDTNNDTNNQNDDNNDGNNDSESEYEEDLDDGKDNDSERRCDDTHIQSLTTATDDRSRDGFAIPVIEIDSASNDHDLFFLGEELASMFGRNRQESYLDDEE